LRRCIGGGIIGLPLIGVGPSFKADKTKNVQADDQGSARTVPTFNFGRRLTSRCSEPTHHKVLGRGRPSLPRGLWPRARVLNGRRAVAELGS
jgi:hypothetical protein